MGCNVMDNNSYAKYAKRIIIGLAAVAISLALITTNNVATMWAVLSMRNGSTAVASGDTAAPAQDSGAQQSSQSTGLVPVNPSGSTSSSTVTPSGSGTGSSTSAGTDNTSTATPAGNTEAGTPSNTDSGSKPADSGKQDKPADAGKTDAGKTDAPSGEMTKEQIVDLYVKSLNNAKAKASKVVLVKDGALNYNDIFEAGAFSSFAGMLKAFFKLEDVNSESTREELPPRNANCNLNIANVESATCKEENGVYTVEIILKDSNNPTQGDGGVGAVVNIITQDQITGGVEGIPGISLSNINLLYTQVKIVATIDKATGNLTYVVADAPSILSLDAKAFVMSINGARVGIETVSEFSIEY